MTTKKYKAVKLYVNEAEYDQAMEILRSQDDTASRWFRKEIKRLLLNSGYSINLNAEEVPSGVEIERFDKFSGGKDD